MRVVGRGAEQVRATHAKTIEFCLDPAITERATCVVAVDATMEDAGPPLVGPLRIELTAGDVSVVVQAEANPLWQPGDSLVIRRSGLRAPGTLATDADLGAADLPPEFVAAARDPNTPIVADIGPAGRRADGRRDIVLLWADGPSPRLTAERAIADAVVAEDAGARALAAPFGDPAAAARVLVVATADLPGTGVRGLLAESAVDTANLAPPLAAAAASPSSAPVLLAAPWGGAKSFETALRASPPSTRYVFAVPVEQLGAALAIAARVRGTHGAVVAGERYRPHRVVAGQPTRLPARAIVHCCLDATASEAETTVPRLADAVRELAASGLGTSAIARVVATLADLPRREAYAYVLEVARDDAG